MKNPNGRLAQLVRALHSHCRGHWFKSSIVHRVFEMGDRKCTAALPDGFEQRSVTEPAGKVVSWCPDRAEWRRGESRGRTQYRPQICRLMYLIFTKRLIFRSVLLKLSC